MGEINKTDKLDVRGLNQLQRNGTLVGPENPNQLKCLTFVPVMITLAQPIFP